MNNVECDLVIIGSGPAGMTAAIYAARAGIKTLILESTGAGGQILSTSEIDNFPGFTSISGSELAMKMQVHVEECGVETVYDEIKSISLQGKKVANSFKKEIVCSDSTIVCDAVIIATGASPRRLGCPEEEAFIGRGIHFCALCDGAFYKDKTLVIAGGGNSAVEEVLYLSPIAKSITIINAMPNFTAFKPLIEKVLGLPNVIISHNTKITNIIGDKKLEGIKTDSGEIVPCDGVFVAIGRKPNTDFLSDLVELSSGGYVIADNKMQAKLIGSPKSTSCGIFAAGDVREKHVRQIITACSDGAIAATHAAEYIRGLKS